MSIKRSSTPGNTSGDFPLLAAVYERVLCEQVKRRTWTASDVDVLGLSGAVVLNSSTVVSQNCEMFRTT